MKGVWRFKESYFKEDKSNWKNNILKSKCEPGALLFYKACIHSNENLNGTNGSVS